MRNLLITTLVALGFSFSANAGELVFSGIAEGNGTAGGVVINDEDAGDNTVFGFNGEYYKSMSDALQIGGRFGFADADAAETQITIAILGRYNLGEEMNTSMFAFGGVSQIQGLGFADVSQTNIHLGFGKRFALAENITWQPSVEVRMAMAGDADEGMSIYLNLLSFGGMVDLF